MMAAVEPVASLQTKVCPACNAHYGEDVAFCSRDGTSLVVDSQAGKTDLAGQVLAERYRIVKLLGEGGMGQVYEAQHVNINKRFALKLLRPEIVSNSEAVARFRQEAWSASSIGHENIIEIDDFATLPSGAVYLAMEYLEGQPLSERMRTPPPMKVDEALDVLLQVCRGLDAAHQKGIVHRDMKPENVFLAARHNRTIVKILDFGIAKVSGAEGSQSLTRTGTIFGTPHYMSPEQALGRALDHRSDIYSVGVIMYEAFTGRVPFEAETFMGILTKHITVEPVPPSQLAPDREIPAQIEAVIMKAMTKDAANRYQSMSEVVADLTCIAEVLAPNVLTLPSGSISAQRSAQFSAATPSSMRAAMGPPGNTPLGVPVAAGALSTTMPSDDDVLGTLKPTRRGPFIALALLLVAGGGAAAFFLLRAPHEPVAPVVVAPAVPVAPAPPSVAKPVEPAAPVTPTAKDVVVLVDSEPVGAQILIDGVSIGDTPRNMTLTGGKAETLVLHKAGFLDQPLVLDGKSEARRVVRLVRMPGKGSSGRTLPAPPPLPAPPVLTPPPTIAPPTVAPPRVIPPPAVHAGPKRSGHDPYERVSEPKKGAELIDPY